MGPFAQGTSYTVDCHHALGPVNAQAAAAVGSATAATTAPRRPGGCRLISTTATVRNAASTPAAAPRWYDHFDGTTA